MYNILYNSLPVADHYPRRVSADYSWAEFDMNTLVNCISKRCTLPVSFKDFSPQIILEADALAESVRMKGDAEAFAIEAKARAEAEQMQKKADAWQDYQEAAMIDMVLSTLPKVSFKLGLFENSFFLN